MVGPTGDTIAESLKKVITRIFYVWGSHICKIKKSRFVKEQEARGLLSNLGIKTPLSKNPLLNVLF